MQPRLSIWPEGASVALPCLSTSLRRSLAWPVGSAEVWLPLGVEPPVNGTPVQLTAGDTAAPGRPVFTGSVARVVGGAEGARLSVQEGTVRLARLRVDRAFRSTNVGQVIADLAAEVDLPTGVLAPGATLPDWALLQERGALDQLLRLAWISGLILRLSADGLLHATPPLASPGACVISREQEICGFEILAPSGRDPTVRVLGDGALGKQGAGAGSWIRADLSPMQAGEDLAPESLFVPDLKTAADVQNLRQAEQQRRAEADQGLSLTLARVVEVDLAEVVTLMGFPMGDGLARVTGIEVCWDASRGYLCALTLERLA